MVLLPICCLIIRLVPCNAFGNQSFWMRRTKWIKQANFNSKTRVSVWSWGIAIRSGWIMKTCKQTRETTTSNFTMKESAFSLVVVGRSIRLKIRWKVRWIWWEYYLPITPVKNTSSLFRIIFILLMAVTKLLKTYLLAKLFVLRAFHFII